MHVFMTGATGYVGSRVVPLLRARGHEVSALAQDEGKAARLRAAGVAPVPGRLDDVEVLGRAAAAADGVVHLGFIHDFARFAEVVEIERRGSAAIVEALRGSGRPVLGFAGSTVHGDTGDEVLEEARPVDPAASPFAARWRGTEPLRDPGAGVRGATLALPVWVYGHGGSVFLPHLLAVARARGESIVPGEGAQRSSEVHVDDAADAVVRVLESPEAGGTYFVGEERDSTLLEKAEAVAAAAGGVPVRRVGLAEAEAAWGPGTGIIVAGSRAPGRRLVRELGWRPRGPGLALDVARGSYAAGGAA